ncbi:DUF2521 family protein [Bacillus piscicola]|uniref:DUF2521 family protein n=1 Tax=Bacillus piscicola TaxID=1632684 RepID=UPI001F0927BC|nr:DUF2521 family protein [Bacillus piscicola]
MGVVVALEPHRIKREWEEEKKLLGEISVNDIQLTAKEIFTPVFTTFHFSYSFLEEACMDLALEAFLSGGKFSKFVENNSLPFRYKLRAVVIIGGIASELYTFISGWVEGPQAGDEEIKGAVEEYITFWWKKGLEAGYRRKRLGLQ